MGSYAKLSVKAADLADYEAAIPAPDAPSRNGTPGAPVSGCASRDGKPIAFTLETTAAPDNHRVLPEHMIMVGLVLLSFCVAIFHLLG